MVSDLREFVVVCFRYCNVVRDVERVPAFSPYLSSKMPLLLASMECNAANINAMLWTVICSKKPDLAGIQC